MLPELTSVSMSAFIKEVVVLGMVAGFILRCVAGSSPVARHSDD